LLLLLLRFQESPRERKNPVSVWTAKEKDVGWTHVVVESATSTCTRVELGEAASVLKNI
jgi:hypothetical protein